MSEQSETASASSADLEPGTNVGGYLVDAKIGEGGMGVVYGAHHPRIGKRVAIKVLSRAYCGDPAVVERFEQEARFVNEIKHPNIVDVFQFGELADKRSFFVMEWLEGEPLSALIDRGPVSAAETMEILDVVCDALQAAHEAKVVHRDLKSDNIFLVMKRGKRIVKLLDFGLAKLAGRGVDGQPVGTTKSGILVGTPAYMSPEQARGKAVDGRTDVYALGCLAYKMLTGTLPFPGDNAMDIILQQLNAPTPNPLKLAPKTPPALAKLVMRMMAKSADDRPTLVEIRETFAELATTSSTSSSSAPTRKKPISTTFEDTRPVQDRGRKAKPVVAKDDEAERPAPRKRATGVLVAIMLLLAGVIGVAVFMLVNKKDTAAPPAAKTDDVTMTVSAEPIDTGSAATGSAARPTEQPVIEFEEDPVGKGSGAGSAHKPHRKATGSAAGSAEETDVADEPALPPPNKPGGIIVVLEHASTISIDGKVVGQGTQGGRYEVAPGHHDVKIEASDRSPITRSVEMDPGGTAFIKIVDDKNSAPEAPKPEAAGSAQ
ncbi:MAG TPA: serine/threonine-protein kinase [Kofleriaceae bacterium]|nr:serine/threonine-protein kinase [Kofleriaceae bacterium]